MKKIIRTFPLLIALVLPVISCDSLFGDSILEITINNNTSHTIRCEIRYVTDEKEIKIYQISSRDSVTLSIDYNETDGNITPSAYIIDICIFNSNNLLIMAIPNSIIDKKIKRDYENGNHLYYSLNVN